MKKTMIFFAYFLILITILPSCDLSGKNFAWHPTETPMSKWMGENIELYILPRDEIYKGDLMIIDFGETKLAFYVWWHQNGLTQLSLRDKRVVDLGNNEDFAVAYFEGKTVSKTKYLLYSISTKNLPKNLFPEEIILERVATNLSYEDVPDIETSEN